ncbi:MAG: Fe-S cluster assembly protein IscX [Anaerolineae bacterium]|nr:Fe-S cluster assembly protein IscX [Anaerolineae bacterium]
MNQFSQSGGLHWDATYEIVLSLCEVHPDIDIDSIGLEQLYQYIVALPNFTDDPRLANEGILNEILREWYEEVNP